MGLGEGVGSGLVGGGLAGGVVDAEAGLDEGGLRVAGPVHGDPAAALTVAHRRDEPVEHVGGELDAADHHLEAVGDAAPGISEGRRRLALPELLRVHAGQPGEGVADSLGFRAQKTPQVRQAVGIPGHGIDVRERSPVRRCPHPLPAVPPAARATACSVAR